MIGTHTRSTSQSLAHRRHVRTLRRTGLPPGLVAVQGVLAYEWLVSGIDKLINPNFTVQFAGTIRGSLSGNPYGGYVSFLRDVVLPHASLFGLLTEVGEFAIGVTLIVSAALWALRPQAGITRKVALAACGALAGAIFLSLNYFLQGGSPLPVINPANAFNEGVDIDILIPLLSVTLLIANIRGLRAGASGPQPVTYIHQEPMSWAS